MILYIAVALWPLLIGSVYRMRPISFNGKSLGKKFHIILAMLPLFLMIAFRHMLIGADTYMYLQNFEHAVNTPLKTLMANSRMEDGYLAFVKFIATYVTQDPNVYQVIYTAIYAVCVFVFMLDLEDYWPEFLFFFATLGLFTFMFTGVRQCLAMCLCLVAYRYARRKNILLFALFVALAYQMHNSAILFAVVYFAARMKVKWYNILLYIVFAIWAAGNLDFLNDWFDENLGYDVELESGTGLIFLLFLTLLTVMAVFLLYSSKRINKTTAPLLTLSFFCLYFWILRLQTRVAERPSYYFMFFACGGFAYAVNSVEDTKQRTLVKWICLGACLVLFAYRLATNFSPYVPYHTFFG